MFKEIFERPAGEGEKKIENLSEEEKDQLVKEEEERLQKLMNTALTTVKMAAENKFITSEKADELYDFLESVNDEISAADLKSETTEETIFLLTALGKLLLLPEDAKKQEELDKNSELIFQRIKQLESNKAESIKAGVARERHKKPGKSTGLFGMKNRARKNSRNADNRPDSEA